MAVALGYSNPRKAIGDHVDEEDKGVTKCDTLGGTQELRVINESGLYSLILSSKLQSARKFKRWVTGEVLPALRKIGTYSMKPKYEPTRPLTTDDYTEAARIVSRCTPSRLSIVLDLLEKGGFCIPEIKEAPTIEMVGVGIQYQIPDSVTDYLEGVTKADIENTPTCNVYHYYTQFCEQNGDETVSNIMFSKYVNSLLGMESKTKKINGVTKRVFVIVE